MYAFLDITSETVETSSEGLDSFDRSDTQTEWFVGNTFKFKENISNNNLPFIEGIIPIDFVPSVDETYYLLYAIITTGDSFGYDKFGNFEIIGLYKNYEEARINLNNLKMVDDKTTSTTITINDNEVKMSIPWSGYFEFLEKIKIKEVTMKSKA